VLDKICDKEEWQTPMDIMSFVSCLQMPINKKKKDETLRHHLFMQHDNFSLHFKFSMEMVAALAKVFCWLVIAVSKMM